MGGNEKKHDSTALRNDKSVESHRNASQIKNKNNNTNKSKGITAINERPVEKNLLHNTTDSLPLNPNRRNKLIAQDECQASWHQDPCGIPIPIASRLTYCLASQAFHVQSRLVSSDIEHKKRMKKGGKFLECGRGHLKRIGTSFHQLDSDCHIRQPHCSRRRSRLALPVGPHRSVYEQDLDAKSSRKLSSPPHQIELSSPPISRLALPVGPHRFVYEQDLDAKSSRRLSSPPHQIELSSPPIRSSSSLLFPSSSKLTAIEAKKSTEDYLIDPELVRPSIAQLPPATKRSLLPRKSTRVSIPISQAAARRSQTSMQSRLSVPDIFAELENDVLSRDTSFGLPEFPTEGDILPSRRKSSKYSESSILKDNVPRRQSRKSSKFSEVDRFPSKTSLRKKPEKLAGEDDALSGKMIPSISDVSKSPSRRRTSQSIPAFNETESSIPDDVFPMSPTAILRVPSEDEHYHQMLNIREYDRLFLPGRIRLGRTKIAKAIEKNVGKTAILDRTSLANL